MAKWYSDFLDLPKQLPEAQFLHRLMKQGSYNNVRDIAEAAELGIPLEELLGSSPIGTDPNKIREIYLQHSTEFGKLLYSED